MRAIWMSNPAGNTWPLWDLIHDMGCNRVYFMAMVEAFEEGKSLGFIPNARQINNTYRAAVAGEAHHNGYGIVRDAHWDGTPGTAKGALELAAKANEDINAATGSNPLLAVPYQFDIEFPYRDGGWLVTAFKEFRRLRPTTLLSWTMEPGQGGWIKASPKLVDWINRDANMVVVPQTFGANMEPYDRDHVHDDLVYAGIRPARVRLMLDAAKPRPLKWDGCLFHMERAVV